MHDQKKIINPAFWLTFRLIDGQKHSAEDSMNNGNTSEKCYWNFIMKYMHPDPEPMILSYMLSKQIHINIRVQST